MRKPTMWFLNRPNINQAVQARKMAKGFVDLDLYYLCNENKGDDLLRSYCEADLCLCFYICIMLVLS